MEYMVDIPEKKREFRELVRQLTGRKDLVEVVEAEDRWDAVVKAAERWGVEAMIKMQDLWENTSVKKVKRKRFREWRVVG